MKTLNKIEGHILIVCIKLWHLVLCITLYVFNFKHIFPLSPTAVACVHANHLLQFFNNDPKIFCY